MSDTHESDETPLALATFEQLVEEMRRRTDAMFLITLKKDKVHDEGWWPEYWSKGGQFVAIGLCRFAERAILDDTVRYMGGDEGEDESHE